MSEAEKVAAATVKPRRTRLYAAAWSAVSIIIAAVFTARAFSDKGERVPDELWFVWIGSLFDAVWVLGVELRQAWQRISSGRASMILIGPMFAATILASIVGGLGCSGRHIVGRLQWNVEDGPAGPGSCRVVLVGDGEELGRWEARLCPKDLLRTPPGGP